MGLRRSQDCPDRQVLSITEATDKLPAKESSKDNKIMPFSLATEIWITQMLF
jgi:hypothetical protein